MLEPRCDRPRDELLDLDQDHRHVVVLRRARHERVDLPQDPLAQLVGRQVAVLADEPRQARLAEAVRLGVHRLADAVGEEQQHVAAGRAAA